MREEVQFPDRHNSTKFIPNVWIEKWDTRGDV